MSIQTVIVEHYSDGCTIDDHAVLFLEESPDIVSKSIDLHDHCPGSHVSTNRTVYSLEEYMAQQTRPLSDFCPPAPKKGIWWLTVDLNDIMSQIGIVSYSIASATAGLTLVEHHHVTLAFDVTEEDKPEVTLTSNCIDGEFLPRIKVRGLAYNDKCACLVVDFIGYTRCCNKHPHITLATAEGISPVYSNDMLEGKDGPYSFMPLEAELEGSLEFFEFK